MYRFDVQLRKGEGAERQLDEYFGEYCLVEPASLAEQRAGVDRYFTDRQSGHRFSVEYKADFLAHRTGNAFVETVSVDTAGKPGWSTTSHASYLLYFVVEDLLVYMIPMDRLRALLPGWARSYRKARAVNDGYTTHGVLVPLVEFERHSDQVICL